ncbi:MAG: GAF domain-containing protein [Opitutaceae bacterium]|nr:GAF domain-containing protein [Opitutaceae bacterium]
MHDYDPTRRELRLHAWSATGDSAAARLTLPPATVSVDLALLAAVIRSGKVMEFQNIDGPGYSEAGDLPRDRTLCSALAAPLMLDGLPTGVLTIFYDQAHRFNDHEKRLATALASFAAVALQNARLYARIFHTEEVLRKNETLTTLGLLAAEIAHEIRNPLTVIKLLHGTLGLDFSPADPRRRDLAVITDKITQLETIVTRVLSFGRTSSALHARWALSEILDDTLVLLRAKLAQANVQCHYANPERVLYLNGNKGQLQQVLLNLILNAVQAMPQGGHLTLRHSVEGTRLQLEVTDTGSGIPAAIQPRIFESFLSGRADGTGLGLAIAQRIMKDHQGELTLAATGPQGTTMRLTLPLLPV